MSTSAALPIGWARKPTGEIAHVQGGIQKQPKRRPVSNRFPFLRVANVMRDHLDLNEVHEVELFDGELERYRLLPGDLLVVEGNGSVDQIGRSARWSGQIANCVHQNHLIRVRPGPAIDSQYLNYFWNSPQSIDHLKAASSSTSGLYVLSAAKVRRAEIPVPPLAEQHRIVAAIEEYFSHLDAGVASLDRVWRNLGRMRRGMLDTRFGDVVGPKVGVGELATLIQYGYTAKAQMAPVGPKMLRITDIQGGTVQWDKVPYCNLDMADGKKYLLETGDIVFARTGATVGKSYLISEHPTSVFASYLIRIQLGPRVLPEYMALFFQTSDYWRQISEGQVGIGQPNVNATKLSRITLCLPSLEEQSVAIKDLARWDDRVGRLRNQIPILLTKCQRLQASMLTRAFSGRLTGPNE